ncbi:hypothetical protein CC86DRAFT_327513 [Ophiobolus disseminans]|uniref:Rhodopsin domain-containing protein n=1 Tax=Ophiobolus disseminans TaxID=1469910 RepID=A0A6A6ZSB3_9PLEO|nr:hypothetical protein CC86DRAFT_327513 [Ophiobolus disseminans]
MGSDYKPTFLAVGIIFPILAGIVVALRFKARRLVKQPLQTDDWLALVALIFAYGFTAIVLTGSRMGNLGGHMEFDEMGIPQIGPWYKYFAITNYAMIIVWNACVGITKLSIAFLYKRIFGTRGFNMISWATIGLLVAWTIAFVLVGIFPCSPISDGWTTEVTTNCINAPATYTAGVASNIGLDIIILVIPIHQVWKLHMPLRRKIGVAMIFALGSFVIITGIIRLVLLINAFGALENPMWRDITYEYSPPMLWTIVELNLGVMCACLPLMRPVWRASMQSPWATKLLSSFSSLRYSSKQSKGSSYQSFDKHDEMEMGIVNSGKTSPTASGRTR